MAAFDARLQEALGSAYQIERELPLGGLGRLFLATEVASGRQVSVQALPPDLAARVDLDRFRAAVDTVARLRHPGILPLIAAGARDDIVYCVWPHPSGESLRYRLIRDGGLSADETVQVLHDVADALDYGHQHGVVHGDLRPDNIYVENGRAFIAEFGIRSALNAALGSEGGMDARADVHALAIAGQQMLAGRATPVTGLLARALSIDPGEQFGDAAAFRDAVGAPPSSRRRWKRWRLAAGGAVLAVALLVLWAQTRVSPPLDDNMIAVAPFDVFDQAHEVWREGLVTVLSANLDGAGPLRTVPPSLVIRRWSGHADPASAARLGRRSGARLALFGRVEHAGHDSVRLTASLIDVETGAGIAELTVVDERFDRLADTLTVRVLRELSRTRPIGAVRTASLGTGSLPALRAFLDGERHYRRSEWDSALIAYQRAIDLDSTFSLALYRAGLTIGWLSNSGDSLSTDYLTRAAAHNRGLPPRDSMLIVAESLTAALDEGPDLADYWHYYRRLYATTAEAARRFPRDPEVWYEYGDVRYHWPQFSTKRQMREAFDRSIALDSAFAPAYLHPVQLASQLGDGQGARGYVRRYLALHPRDVYADAMRLTEQLLDHRRAHSAEVQAVLDTASNDLLIATFAAFDGWADSLETTLRLARLMSPSRTTLSHADPLQFQLYLGSGLSYHGHLREAWQRASAVTWVEATTAWMGGMPPDTARRVFGAALDTGTLYPRNVAAIGAPFLASRRDTASLEILVRRADSLARASKQPMERAFGRYVADGARALAALARGDTTTAIKGLLALPDTGCGRCQLYQVQLAQLLDARKMNVEAERLLRRDPPGMEYPTDGFWYLYRARLAGRMGNRAGAEFAYRFVHDVWLNADPPLQAYVREAREALKLNNED